MAACSLLWLPTTSAPPGHNRALQLKEFRRNWHRKLWLPCKPRTHHTLSRPTLGLDLSEGVRAHRHTAVRPPNQMRQPPSAAPPTTLVTNHQGKEVCKRPYVQAARQPNPHVKKTLRHLPHSEVGQVGCTAPVMRTQTGGWLATELHGSFPPPPLQSSDDMAIPAT